MSTSMGFLLWLVICCLLIQGNSEIQENQKIEEQNTERPYSDNGLTHQHISNDKDMIKVTDTNDKLENNEDDIKKDNTLDHSQLRTIGDMEQVIATESKPEGEKDSLSEDSNKDALEDSGGNQSFFSIGNILRKIVDPMLEDIDKTVDGKDIMNVSNKTSELAVNISDSLSNSTAEEIMPLKNKTEKKTKFTCVGKNMTLEENRTAVVEIINNTKLVNLLSFDQNETTSDCILVLFYVPYCVFCAQIAASYNALARVFPQLEVVAVDAAQFSNLNAKFGTVSVPNILLFHQSRSAVRFNQTEKSFENLVDFVKNSTGLTPNMTVNVTEEDYIGPLLSVPVESVDYLLWVSWVFVIICSSFMFINSNKGQQWINKVKLLWQEHQHID